MGTPFSVLARCEHKNVEPATSAAPTSRLWASIKIDPLGGGLERERAPLAVALVADVSGSMQGPPIEHVIRSCEILIDLLGERDQLAIVAFASEAEVRCGLTPVDAAGKTQLRRALGSLAAGGNTNLHGGLGVAAGVLVTAPAGLRRAMVVMSDGQPNVGLSSASDLAGYVTGLKLAVSSLGFGLSHDETVLEAISTAGSGRYAYVPDPALARVDLARAALAHGGIVADQLELRLQPADGVELLQVVPASALRVGSHGVATAIGDVFVDEGRSIALELQLALGPRATGRLAAITVSGRAPDGTVHTTTASLDVDIRTGARVVDRDAQRDIALVQADAARVQARAQADRGALPAAAEILRQAARRIDAIEGFVRNDGSLLAELREQLDDEIANYLRKSTDQERGHQRKGSMSFKAATPGYSPRQRQRAAIPAQLVGITGLVAGQRFELFAETVIGRSSSSDVFVASEQLSRMHIRLVCLDDGWILQDTGSSNGSFVNGVRVDSCQLKDNDRIRIGNAEFRFNLLAPCAG
jgi:Ca-activated chloride channel family protein